MSMSPQDLEKLRTAVAQFGVSKGLVLKQKSPLKRAFLQVLSILLQQSHLIEQDLLSKYNSVEVNT
jgi:hypothetical protein